MNSALHLALRGGASLVGLLAAVTPVRADPIFTPIIVGLFASAGITGTVATVGASLISALIVTGVGIGLSMLFAPKPPKPENGTVAVQQPITYRIFGYGTARVPGAVVLKEEANGFLGVVQVLNGHYVHGFEAAYLNDDQVQVNFSGACLSGYVGMGGDGRYEKNRITIDSRQGNVPETPYPIIQSQFGDIWSETARGDGCASIAMLCAAAPSKEFPTTYPNGQPQLSAIVDQYEVFDPRNGQWYFSKNSALCLLHFQCFSEFGSQRDYATAVLPNLASWITAADACDDTMPTKAGGNEPRYQLGGYTTSEQDRNSTLRAMLATCDGFFVEKGDGTVDLKVGVYVPPTVTLTDDDIISFSVQLGVATEDVIDTATAKYTSPSSAYATVETDPVVNTAEFAARPGPPRSSQMDLTWVQSTGQASRLLAREMSRQTEGKRGSIVCKLSALGARTERWIQISSNTIPLIGSLVIENVRSTISIQEHTVTIEFVSSGPQVDVYDPAKQESSPPTVVTRPSSTGLPVPANVQAVPVQVNDSSGNASVYLQVSWDVPIANGNALGGQTYVVQIRTSDIGSGAGAWNQQEFDNPPIIGSRIVVQTQTVPINTQLDVQVCTLGSYSLGTFSNIVQASSQLQAVPPGSVTNVSVSGYSGTTTVSWTNPQSANFASAVVYRGPTGASYAQCAAVSGRIYGGAGADASYSDNPAAGTYVYYVTALSQVGAAATPVGPVRITLT